MRERRWAEHILVGGELENLEIVGQAQFALDFFDRLAGNVGPEFGDVRANPKRLFDGGC